MNKWIFFMTLMMVGLAATDAEPVYAVIVRTDSEPWSGGFHQRSLYR
ncbi:MAG: hypothetical protein U0T81_09345 [Saprospiraceae bacterium]